jgi:hypothetical protein
MYDSGNDDDGGGSLDAAALIPSEPGWQPIFHASNQVVLYNPTSQALSIRHSASSPPQHSSQLPCPYCHRPIPNEFLRTDEGSSAAVYELVDDSATPSSRASNYFQLLEYVNEAQSRPSTPPPPLVVKNYDDEGDSGSADEERQTRQARASPKPAFKADAMAEGYFKAFFQEECKLGMGANGSVYLCQVCPRSSFAPVLPPTTHPSLLSTSSTIIPSVRRFQTPLSYNCRLIPLTGYFAVKKIAVGESHSYLLKTLREVGNSVIASSVISSRVLFVRYAFLNASTIPTLLHTTMHGSSTVKSPISVRKSRLCSSSFLFLYVFTQLTGTQRAHAMGRRREVRYHISTLRYLLVFAPVTPSLIGCNSISLDDFINHRRGKAPKLAYLHHLHHPPPFSPSAPLSPSAPESSSSPRDQPYSQHASPTLPHKSRAAYDQESASSNPLSRKARIRAFREYQRASPAEKDRLRKVGIADVVGATGAWKAVHLLSAEEIRSLFGDVVEGLAFLVSAWLLWPRRPRRCITDGKLGVAQ